MDEQVSIGQKEPLMADHPNTHNPSVNKRIKQLKRQKKTQGGDAEAAPPDASPFRVLQQAKEASLKRSKSKRKRK